MRCSGVYRNEFDNSNVWERTFLSILTHHVELLDMTIVKKEYFTEEVHSKIFEIMMNECKECFSPIKFIQNGYLDMNYLNECIYGFFMFESSYKEQFMFYEKMIVDNFKRVSQNDLNEKLDLGVIGFDDYQTKIKELNEIRQVNFTPNLNKEIIKEILLKEKRNVNIERFEKLSKVLMLETDDLITVAAPPNFGKTPFLLNLFNEFLNDENNYCQYFNLEVNKDVIVNRLIAIDSKERMIDLKKMSPSVQKSLEKYDMDNYFMCDDPMTLEKLTVEITSRLKPDKQNIVFIDHIGILQVEDRMMNKSNYERVTYLMKQLRIICKKYNVLMFIASQCDRESLRNGKLTLHSLKDSGEIENSSTHVILLYEDKDKEKDFAFTRNVIVDIAKNRNNYTYKLPMNFIGNKQLFIECNFTK